jgi:hypothetical protein
VASARDILINLLGKETVSPAAKKAGDAIEDVGDKSKKTARDAKRLDAEIDELTKSLVANAAAWRAAGSEAERADLAKAMRIDQRQLKQHLNVKKILEGAGEDGAKGFFAGFSQRIGPLMAKAPVSGPVLAALAGAGAAAAPMLSSLIAGAVTTGVAGAGIAAGIKIAVRDPAVQASGKSLGEQFGRDLGHAASSFTPEVLKSIDIISRKLSEIRPQLRTIFDVSSSRVVPLTYSVTEAVDRLIPSLERANARAEPLVDTLNEHIPKAAEAAGFALERFSDDTQNSADALDTLFTAGEAMIGGSATIIGALNKIGPAVSGPLYALGALSEDAGDKMEGAASKSNILGSSINRFSDSIPQVAEDFRTFTERINDWTNANLGAENANLRLQAAIDAATAAGKKNNDGIDANTEKGRANRELLIQLADAANANAQAIYEQTGSTEKANAATAAARKQFVLAAIAMGVGATEAERLAGMLFAIPSPNPKITLNTKQAKAEAQVIQSAINGIHGKNVTVGVWFVTHGRNAGDLKVPGGTLTKDRWGGMHVPMAAGGVMSAGIYPASNPPLIQFAEPTTGGEAYIPRKGNARRSMAILEQAARWYDADVVPRRGGGSASMPGGGGGMSESRLAAAVARALAGVVFRIDDQRGRLVGVYARGG